MYIVCILCAMAETAHTQLSTHALNSSFFKRCQVHKHHPLTYFTGADPFYSFFHCLLLASVCFIWIVPAAARFITYLFLAEMNK